MNALPAAFAFQVHASDNVATMLGEAAAGASLAIVGSGSKVVIAAREQIALGHKVALVPIAEGEPVIKFGVIIGMAMRPITPGELSLIHI